MMEASGKMPLLAFSVWTSFSKVAILLEASSNFWPPKEPRKSKGPKISDASCKMLLFVCWDPALEKWPFCPERPHFRPPRG